MLVNGLLHLSEILDNMQSCETVPVRKDHSNVKQFTLQKVQSNYPQNSHRNVRQNIVTENTLTRYMRKLDEIVLTRVIVGLTSPF